MSSRTKMVTFEGIQPDSIDLLKELNATIFPIKYQVIYSGHLEPQMISRYIAELACVDMPHHSAQVIASCVQRKKAVAPIALENQYCLCRRVYTGMFSSAVTLHSLQCSMADALAQSRAACR